MKPDCCQESGCSEVGRHFREVRFGELIFTILLCDKHYHSTKPKYEKNG